MSQIPPIPEALWNTVPPDAQAALMVVFDSLLGRTAEQDQRIADLEARLKLNSTNSSKPPSSDPIGLKRKPPAPPSGRKSGGQPGHAKAQRPPGAPRDAALLHRLPARSLPALRPSPARR
jgi:transposase